MLKRTIRYHDLDGNEIVEDFYFHYSTAEATELKIILGDDIQSRVQKLIDSNNPKEIIQIFKGIIADSIGKRSETGRAFVKTDAYRDEFMGSDAYSEMLLWLLSETKNMSDFVNGIFPANMQVRIGQLVAEREASSKTTVELPKEEAPTPNLKLVPSIQSPLGLHNKKISDYSRQELANLTDEQYSALFDARS